MLFFCQRLSFNAPQGLRVQSPSIVRPDAQDVVRPPGFLFSDIQCYVLLSPYLCFVYFLYHDL